MFSDCSVIWKSINCYLRKDFFIERTSLSRLFSIWEPAYFTLAMETPAEIGSSNITEIKLVQGSQEDVIYTSNGPEGWGLDPAFYFSLDPREDPNLIDFSFMLDPRYIDAIDVGSELMVCVDVEVVYRAGLRETRRFLLTPNDQSIFIQGLLAKFCMPLLSRSCSKRD